MKRFSTIILALLVITAMLASACAPAPPETIIQTVVVEKEVEVEKEVVVVETVEVEVEVEKEVEVVVVEEVEV
ncbi:MAG: hypothetical protein H8E35_03905, partial [Ardenticatenia bacterium]|nr:hypothetical protein [Ardenticatenia bacterium]